MRRLFIVMAFGVAALFGDAAHAGALLAGQSSFSFSLGGDTPLVFAGDGTSAGTSTSASNFTLAAGNAFAGTQTLMLTPTPMNPLSLVSVTIMANAKGVFTGAVPAGSAPITGTAINKALGSTLLKVPVSLGKTGTIMAAGSGIKVTAFGKKWTSGMTTISLGGGMTVMATGSVMAGTPGTLMLVAATKIVTNLNITTSGVGTLTLKYASVPEPALPLLLIAGAATLGIAGTRKLSRR